MAVHESAAGDVSSARGLRHAGAWSVSGRLVARVLDIVVLVVLARVLSPSDFGIVAMAMTVIVLIESATAIPLIQPILRSDEPTPGHYHTAFTLGVVRAAAIAVLVIGAAPLASRYYGENRLTLLLVFLALAPLFRGLASPRLADRIRAYDTRPEFVMVVGGKLVALGLVSAVVLSTGSFWAIAVGSVATPVVMCAVSYLFAPYRPHLSLERWSDFGDVVGWNSVNQLFSALHDQLDRIVLGRAVSPGDLGRFSLALDISSLPIQAFVQPMAPPLLAAFAKADDGDGKANLWLLCLNGLLAVLGPIFVALALLAKPLVVVVLGVHWLDMAPLLSALAAASIIGLVNWVLPPLAVALYRADLPAKRTILTFAIRMPLAIIGVIVAGPLGAIAGRALGTCTATTFTLRNARTLTGLRASTQLWALRRTAAGLLAFGAITALVRPDAPVAAPTLADSFAVAGQMVLAVALGLVGLAVTTAGLWHAEGRPDGLESRIAAIVGRSPARRLWFGRRDR